MMSYRGKCWCSRQEERARWDDKRVQVTSGCGLEKGPGSSSTVTGGKVEYMGTDPGGWTCRGSSCFCFLNKIGNEVCSWNKGEKYNTGGQRRQDITVIQESEGVTGLGKCSRIASDTKGPLEFNWGPPVCVCACVCVHVHVCFFPRPHSAVRCKHRVS